MRFYTGIPEPAWASRFDLAFISVNRLARRKSPFTGNRWIMDSGAFTEISRHGHYRNSPEAYVAEAAKWRHCGTLEAIVTQDYMCEPFILEKTGLTVDDHQRMTIERYDRIVAAAAPLGMRVMPVLQGWTPADYVTHLELYGERLVAGMWVGVGSVCKRNAKPEAVAEILAAIKARRPDLRLHGFGLKATALALPSVVALLESADSMAWSFSARKQGRDQNRPSEAEAFCLKITGAPARRVGQLSLF